MAQAGLKPTTANDNTPPGVTVLKPRPVPGPVMPGQSPELALLCAMLSGKSFKKRCKIMRALRRAHSIQPDNTTVEAALNFMIRAVR